MATVDQSRARIGVVLIGRNEGQRLVRALDSVTGSGSPVVYVDSGSTDDSTSAARERGALVVDLDMSTHMPRIVAFWSTMLFHTGRYSGNAFRPHLNMPGLTADHFARWVAVLERTVDERFEGEVAEWCGLPHAVAVMNVTVALEAALRALDLGAGDEVIVSPRTFIA
jgi:glycosyltransferase involved in cell wall biosynthesis